MKSGRFLKVGLAAGAVFLLAAKKPPSGADYLEKSVQRAGGFSKYQRVESIAYDFAERRFVDGKSVLSTGRHRFKLHDPAGLRGREELSSPSGRTVTVFTSSGTWFWKDGRAVTEPAAVAAARGELERKIFWILAPFSLKEAACPVEYLGMGYVEGRLLRRLEARKGAGLFPSEESFVLLVDSGTFRMEGATYRPPAAAPPQTLLFSDYAEVRSLVFPFRRDVFDEDGRPLAVFTLLNLDVNTYLDENLFTSDFPEEVQSFPEKINTPVHP
ncbi:MAG TPA: hypothetical protein P5079_01235 [Elusimicrobiota bacterium]|nr:hypothetical protein [Elusimicrobiota bacterium]